jgi:serine protease Do
MDMLKKISILVLAVALVAGAIYVIAISYQAQEFRKSETAMDSLPPAGETVKPKDEIDTVSTPQEIPDTLQFSTPAPETVKPETLKWQSLPKTEKTPDIGRLLPGNPNSTFIQAANRILPAVVTIQSEVTVNSVPQDEDHQFFWDRQGDEDQEFFQQGTGSGIIISPNGYILTNYHVVEKASSYRIIFYDKREFEGKFIGGDPNTDVALLKIDVQDLPAAFIGDSDSLQIGEWVMAVGSPLSFTSTITAGIVSALGRNIRIIDSEYSVENFIQTDAVINPGNSGGALINLNGEVIGVNTAIATRTGLYQGYGFAIPINLASKIVNDILIYGEVRRGLLGVSISPVDSRVAKGVGLSKPVGVLVQGLQAGKAAETAGIRAGDIILTVNGSEIVSVNDLQNKIASKSPGEIVTLNIWRNRKSLTVPVKLGQAPVITINKETNNTPKKRFKNLGLEIRDLTQVEKNNVNLENGVYVSDVKAGSPSQKGGVFIGFIIYKINDEIIKDKDDFLEKVQRLQKGRVIKMICRSPRFQNPLDDRILFIEID